MDEISLSPKAWIEPAVKKESSSRIPDFVSLIASEPHPFERLRSDLEGQNEKGAKAHHVRQRGSNSTAASNSR